MTRTVVIAPDSFKGTIGAAAAADALAEGWRTERPSDHVRLLPMADGGEGTVDAFAAAVPGARRMPVTVTGPEGTAVTASWVLLPPSPDAPRGTGVVELANTSGIELLGTPPRLRAFDAHTRGFGEAIADALAHGVSRLVLGIGSSSSTDGGTGMLTALGARFTDAAGAAIAGGTGFGLLAWGATLVPGSAAVADLVGLDAAVAAAGAVVTGEGSYDGQSAAGKVPAHVAAIAAAAGVPVALVAGRITADADVAAFAATASLTELAGSGAAAMADAGYWLEQAGAQLARAVADR